MWVGAAGSADGTGILAQFNKPTGMAADSAGNVYVADTGNNTIRKVTLAGVVTTFAGTAGVIGSADGTGAAAQFNAPTGVAIDSAGNLYVTDSGNATIRKITPAAQVTTFAGTAGIIGSADATGAAASFNSPQGLAIDAAGNLFVADTGNNTIRKISAAGVATTFAGTAGVTGSSDGTGAAASFYGPEGVATDSAGNLYVADTYNGTIRKITPAGVVMTFAGEVAAADGTGAAARFNQPSGLATDSVGNVYVADTFNSIIRKVTPAGMVTTLAGKAGVPGSLDGTGAAARFVYPVAVATDGASNVYVADWQFPPPISANIPLPNQCSLVRKVTPAGVVTTLAVPGCYAGSAPGAVSSLAVDGSGNGYVVLKLIEFVMYPLRTQTTSSLQMITPAGDAVTTLAGQSSFNDIGGLASDGAGNLYVVGTSETYNYNNGAYFTGSGIQEITSAGAVKGLLAGSTTVQGHADGTGIFATFNFPTGVAIDSAGNLYVADTGNNTIRKITSSGVVTTVVGQPGVAGFLPGPVPGALSSPNAVAIFGTTLYTTTGNAIVQVSNVP